MLVAPPAATAMPLSVAELACKVVKFSVTASPATTVAGEAVSVQDAAGLTTVMVTLQALEPPGPVTEPLKFVVVAGETLIMPPAALIPWPLIEAAVTVPVGVNCRFAAAPRAMDVTFADKVHVGAPAGTVTFTSA